MMARLQRPAPPVPTDHEEVGELEDNYGVWDDHEFDDGEVYENFENDQGENEENEESEGDYEEPDEPSAIPPRAASPAQPPVPPRQGGRPAPVPVPNNFLAPKTCNIPVKRNVSPRVSPVMDKRKVVPQPPAPVDDEEMYEAVDAPFTPQPDDDGEVYSEVDNEPLPPIPTITTDNKRSLPPLPKAGIARPPVPNPPNALQPPPEAKPSKKLVSPQMGRREVPMPPQVKSTPPSAGRATRTIQTPLPPPPSVQLEDDADELYEAGDFYEEKQPTQTTAPGKLSKVLPRPPQNDDGSEQDEDDEYYSEVPESSKPAQNKASRPIPPIPQPQSSPMQPIIPAQSFTGSGRIPVEKLKAGLARLAEAKANASAVDEEISKPAEDSDGGSFNGSTLLNARKLLKPVNRGESMNSVGKPITVSVKRAESDHSNTTRSGIENKGSLLSEMKNKLDSKQTEPSKVMKVLPFIPDVNPEPVKKSPFLDRKAFQATPPLPVSSENSGRRTLNNKVAANDNVPPSRTQPASNLPIRNIKDNSMRDSDLKEIKPSFSETVVNRPLPRQPTDELGGFGWFFTTIDRDDAKRRVQEIHQDGAFLIRKSERGGDGNPYTLTLLYNDYIYNLHIRKRKDKKFALGSEKPDEHVFGSVEELVNFHRNNPIEVVGDARKNMSPGKVMLKISPKK